MSSSRRRDERRAAFLMFARALSEADDWVSSGDLKGMTAAVKKVDSAFLQYLGSCRDEASPAVFSSEVRQNVLLALAQQLKDIDRSLSSRNLDDVRVALRQARQAIEMTAALDQDRRRHSGIRERAPRKRAK
jgi:hypothetical protein